MKQTLILTANPDNKSATFTASDKNSDNVNIFITNEPWAIHIGELPTGKRPFRIQFGKYTPEYKIVWDWDSAPRHVRDVQEQIKKFFMNHRNVEVEGFENPRLENPMFKLRVIEDMEKKTYVLNKLYLNVMNLVDNLSLQAKKDLVFFFGGNPTKFTEEQIWLDLIGMDGGRLLNEGNAEIFMKSIRPEQKEENAMRIFIKKAVHYGIIITRDNKYFSQQNDLLGVTEDFVYQYYNGQPELYSYLKKEVNIKEGLVEKEPTQNIPAVETKAVEQKEEVKTMPTPPKKDHIQEAANNVLSQRGVSEEEGTEALPEEVQQHVSPTNKEKPKYIPGANKIK